MTSLLASRKRVNFMIDERLLEEMGEVVPSGDRSDFVNEVLHKALKQLSRQKALERIDLLQSAPLPKKRRSSTEFLNEIRHGRRY